MARWWIAMFGLALILAGCQPTPQPEATSPLGPTEAHVPCADRSPLKNAYFGDLHVHTALSADAYAFDVRTGPDEAYAFAKGAPLALYGGRTAQLERPLDFAAITEHASQLGELSLCIDPSSPVYDGPRCQAYRGEGSGDGVVLGRMPPHRRDTCGQRATDRLR